MKNFSWESLLTRKNAIIALFIISAITWASSITPEFTGYDDIKLIVNNERIHKGPLYTAKFYGNIVSDSHNVAWTNYPTVIYRPLEWFGSAVGYKIWGAQSVLFHIFFNINFHIINTILLFLIMLKIFAGPEALMAASSKASKKGKFKGFKENAATVQSSPNNITSTRAVFLAFLIALLWTVHPLHSEAINMLTSGVGFLWATFFGLSAIVINIYHKELSRLPYLLAISALAISGIMYFLEIEYALVVLFLSPLLVYLYRKQAKLSKQLTELFLIAWSCLSFAISYCGSEMAIIGPVFLLLYYIYSKLVYNNDIGITEAIVSTLCLVAASYINFWLGMTILFCYVATYAIYIFIENQEPNWLKIPIAVSSILIYTHHRSSIVSETHAWASNSMSEFIERLTVIAPEIFFHYIKLFFYPAVLSVDQHHQVILADAGSPYHILCFSVAALFVIGLIYYTYSAVKTPHSNFVKRQASIILAFSILMTGLSIGIALNIIPLYVLARDRYTYIFCLGLTTLIVFLIFNYIYAAKDNPIDLKGVIDLAKARNIDKIFAALVLVILIAFFIRAFVRNLDWHNGEKMWNSTIDSVKHDPGVQQVWRSRLLDYYKDPGTKTFKPDPYLKEKCNRDFRYFVADHNLNNADTFKRIMNQHASEKMVDKYGYTGRKTISSGLFFLAMKAQEEKMYRETFELFRLGHNYYPEHFQININLLVQLHDKDPKATEYLIKVMDQEATHNPFLAKGFMDTLHMIKSPHYFRLAKKYREMNPNTQVFDVFLFNASYLSGRYEEAYQAAKRIVKKYHEEKTFDQYIQLYETGRLKIPEKPLIAP